MNWFTLALLSAVFFTTLNLSQRKLAIDSRYPRAISFLFNLAAICFSLVYFFSTGAYKNIRLPSVSEAWIYLGLAALFYGLFERGRYYAAKSLNASSLSIISNVSLFVAFTGSVFLYSEALTLKKIVGSVLIFLSLILVSYSKRIKFGSLKAIGIGVVVNVMLGLGWMLDKKGVQYFSADMYNIFVWTAPIFFVIFPKIKFSEIRYELRMASWKILVPAFLNVAGYLLQLKAMAIGNATQIIPIVQTSTLMTVLFGILILNEKEHVLKKIFAGFLALIGSYFLIGVV